MPDLASLLEQGELPVGLGAADQVCCAGCIHFCTDSILHPQCGSSSCSAVAPQHGFMWPENSHWLLLDKTCKIQLSSAHRNSCHMPSASVYFQGVKWGACGRNSLCFVCHCPIGYPREGGLLCMIRERISVSFVKLFLYKNNKNWSFSCTPLCQLHSPSVYLAHSCDTHRRQIHFSELLRWEVPGVRAERGEERARTE